MQNIYFEIGIKTFDDDPAGYLEYLKYDKIGMDTNDLKDKIKNKYYKGLDYETK